MQGRLSPPINNAIQAFPFNTWEKEFELANKIGFHNIEWIVDSKDNPIFNGLELQKIIKNSTKYGIKINSLCADYFMTNKLFSESKNELEENLEIAKKIIELCHILKIRIIEIPLVDSSSIRDVNDRKEFLTNFQLILPTIEKYNVTVALETDLESKILRDLIIEINHPGIALNYDIGNSTANNFDIKKEWELLHDWIVNVHIKDRLISKNTVPLGSGDANFEEFFDLLKKYNYKGDLIIQGAREDLDNNSTLPVVTCKKYLEFVKQYLDKY